MLAPLGTITQITPQFVWTAAQNAFQYELQVDDVLNGRAAFYVRTVTTTSHVADLQFSEGDFRARVRTITATGLLSAWSSYANFTIDIPAPIKPVKPRILRPMGDITDSFPIFEWTSDINSNNYSLWIDNAATNQRVIYRTAYVGTTYVHFDPLPNGVYRAWVKGTNSAGESGPWSDFSDFSIDAPIPVASQITAPMPVTSSVNPRIVWNAVAGAARYDLWVNNLTTGVAQYIRQMNISRLTPYYDPPAMPQGSFVAWVRAANGNSEFSPWSTGYSFTVDMLPPSTPKMIGPTGPNGSLTITTANPTFKWTAADRAAKYDLWVNNVTTGQSQIIREQNLTGTQYVALTNLTQGNYRAFVRAINSANEVGEWSSTYSFTLDEPIPVIPVITAPVANPAGTVENPNPTFAWQDDLNAPIYEFRLDDVTLNKTSVISVTNIKVKSYTIPNNQRLAEHIYSAMVRGVNSSGEKSDWSAAYRVRIDVPNPKTPILISPTGTSKDTTPTFQWSHDQGAYRYEILVRDLERNETIVLQVTTVAVDPTGKVAFYTLPDNQALRPGTYRFWIRAFNSLGTSSSWSNFKTFAITASLGLKDLKLVEPAKLQSAEEYYAAVKIVIESEADTAEVGTVETMATAMVSADRVGQPVSVVAMPVAAIEELMESLTDPSSAASVMMSGNLFSDSAAESPTSTTSAAAASILALTMMPVRRKRREA
jgi:predicted phage tail protein